MKKYQILYTIPIFLLTLLLFLHPIVDFSQDLGRHIKLGEIIMKTHSVPKTNLFSYTYPNFPFINHHWFSEVIFYLLNQSLGPFGILICMSILAALSMTLFFIFALKKDNFFTVFISSCLYLCILLSRTYLRPEIFSFLFLSVFMIVLYKNREKLTKWIFILPFLEILWVNMHIYFIIGPLLIFLFLVDAIFSSKPFDSSANWRIRSGKNSLLSLSKHLRQILNTIPQGYYLLRRGEYQILFIVFLLTCLATLFNPNGLTGALYPLHVLSNYGYSIEENQSLSFLINYGIWNIWYTIFFGVSIVLFLLLFIYRKRTSPADWLICVIFTIAAFQAERNISLFVFATFIPFTRLLSKLPLLSPSHIIPVIPDSDRAIVPFMGGSSPLVSRLRGNDKQNKNTTIILVLACVAATITVLFLSIQANGFGLTIKPTAEKGADFFITNNLKGPIFNNFDIGSYLDYRLYPHERVFVDGRPEAYPVDFFQKIYIPMQQNPNVFEKIDQKYHFQSIFFSYIDQTPWARQFIPDIMQNPNWQMVYLDTFSAIWVKKDGVNKDIALQYPINQDSFGPPNDQGLTTKDYFHLAYFLQLIGWNQELIPVLQKIIELDPTNCQALGILAQNPSTQALYAFRYQNSCH